MLFSATDRFVREKIGVVHEGGFKAVTEVLMALFQNLDLDGTRLTTIAARARMTKQSMLELVDKSEALGFVGRRPDPDDQRAKIVAFTPSGRRMLDRLLEGVAEAERRMAAAIGPDFVTEMKARLTVYVASESLDARGALAARVSTGLGAWRTGNVGRVLVLASDLFVADMLRVVHDSGFDMVTDVQLALFRNLDLDGTRLTELAGRARMTKQGMLQLVNKAASLDLVERLPDNADGRAKIVMFTPSGLRMLGRLRTGEVTAERRMAAIVGQVFVTDMKARLTAYVVGHPSTHAARAMHEPGLAVAAS